MSVKAAWGQAQMPTPRDDDPFAGRAGEDGPIEEASTSANGNAPQPDRTVSQKDLWERRDETTHPMPVGYWREDDYTIETPMEMLEGRFQELLRREGNSFDAGITCDLKDQGEMSCSACPVSECGQDTPLSVLCKLGREQERVLSLIITKRTREGTDG